MKFDRTRVRPGMTAFSQRGENLGKVARADDQSFIIEKGVFFPKDYLLRYEYIMDIRGDQLVYALEEAGAGEATATPAVSMVTPAEQRAQAAVGRAGNGSPRERSALRTDLELGQELRMSLRDEEITVEKVTRETGHVRIHKAVRSEQRHITVPVTREEVVVERVPASQATRLAAGDDPFEEGDIDLTVHEEEVRVSKHPVVREEVLVRRVAHEEQREAAATLLHEEIRVEDTTDRNPRATRKG
jgi:uncharacterized protein (TIGR02271 family)